MHTCVIGGLKVLLLFAHEDIDVQGQYIWWSKDFCCSGDWSQASGKSVDYRTDRSSWISWLLKCPGWLSHYAQNLSWSYKMFLNVSCIQISQVRIKMSSKLRILSFHVWGLYAFEEVACLRGLYLPTAQGSNIPQILLQTSFPGWMREDFLLKSKI